MSIAERRHHDQRIKAKFYRTVKRDELRTPDRAGRFANHGKDCSCHMCGNPRRHFGERSIQERRQAVTDHKANIGIYDGDTDSPCVWHCTDDDPDSQCEAI